MKKIYTLFALLTASFVANAQHYLGISNSNYSELNSLYLNPANLADSRHKFQFNLFSLNAVLANNYAGLKSTRHVINYLKDSNGQDFKDLLYYSDNGKKKNVDVMAEIRLPAFMFSINPNHGVSVNTRVRGFGQISGVNSELLSLANEGFDKVDMDLYNNIINNKGLGVNGHAFFEIGLSYGAVLYNKETHFVKGGLTAKYLSGAGVAQARNDDFSLDFDYNPATKDVSLLTNKIDMALGYTDFNRYKDFTYKDFLGKDRIGAGYGFDLGFIYEFRPEYDSYKYEMDETTHIDHSVNKYKFKLSLAVTDIGRIKYKNQGITKNYALKSNTPVAWTDADINSFNFDNIETILTNKYGSQFSKDGDYKAALPTTLNLQADYHIARKFYASGTFIQSLNNSRVPSLYKTLVSVAPRYETRHFEASLPVTYVSKYNQVNFGAAIRAGFFFIGSDDLAGMIGLRKLQSTNLYLGITIGLAKKRLKDKDGDLISRKFDKCPKIPGPKENNGCPYPDTDGDGVVDKDDKCPTTPGLATLNGCPDTDKDNIIDSLDACPTQAGPESTKGCPDKDNDGIADTEDNCPNEAGTLANKGCPDKDGDGLIDKNDKCPDVAGPVENNGCPVEKPAPVLTKAEEKVINKAVANLEFELSKAVIKAQSFASLDAVAALLQEHPELKLTLAGHTDNTGNAAKNLTLSEKRAEAVKDYLIKKGVSAERITAIGHGQTKPIATNKTPAGRQKNRRVEFKVE